MNFPSLNSIQFAPWQERLAQQWFDSSDPSIGVGARHHTVPAFYLRRFADDDELLLVRDRVSGKLFPPRTVSKHAITDFYTVINKDGAYDGRMEQLLAKVEGEAAQLFKLLLSPYRQPGQMTEAEKSVLCQFLAFQMVRGPRKRREVELQTDYVAKLQAGDELTDQDLVEITAVPHPNEHIKLMGSLSLAIYRHLLPRPVHLVRIDAPLFVTCDEPVLVDNDDHVQHRPECSITAKEMRRRRLAADAAGTTYSQHIHVWPTRPSGVQVGDAIAMPLTPSVLLILGGPGEQSHGQAVLRGQDARELAEEVNALLVAQAYEWVAARPDHPSFRDWTFPVPGPLIGVCDGGSIMSRQLRSAPPHRWQRLRRDWPGMPHVATT